MSFYFICPPFLRLLFWIIGRLQVLSRLFLKFFLIRVIQMLSLAKQKKLAMMFILISLLEVVIPLTVRNVVSTSTVCSSTCSPIARLSCDITSSIISNVAWLFFAITLGEKRLGCLWCAPATLIRANSHSKNGVCRNLSSLFCFHLWIFPTYTQVDLIFQAV